MTNQVSQLDLDAIAALFGSLLTFVKDFVFSMVTTLVGIITTPAVLGSLVTIAILYGIWRKVRSKMGGA